jgi:dipeptidyl aminopeptidase/acylaminoacyl peptidase
MCIVGSTRLPARRLAVPALAAFALVSVALASAAAEPSVPVKPPPPASVFGALPQVTEVKLSPNGALLAWAIDQGAKGRTVVVMDLATNAMKRTIPIGSTGKLRHVTWHDDETLLVTISIAQEVALDNNRTDLWEVFRTIAVDVNGAEPKILMPENARTRVSGATIVAYRTAQPKTVLLSRLDYSFTAENSVVDTRLEKKRADSGWISRLYAVDVRSGKSKIVESGTQFTSGWVVDRDGRPVAREEWEPTTKSYRLLAKRGGSWPEIYARTDGQRLSIVSLSDDGSAVLAVGIVDGGPRKLVAVPLAGGAPQVVAANAGGDVFLTYDEFDGRPIAVGSSDGDTDRWLDAEAGKVYAQLARAFPQRQVDVESRSRDWSRVVVQVSAPDFAPTYYLVDLRKRTADIVGEPYPALVDVPLGPMKAIDYAARDGTRIPAFLTLPPGSAGKSLPLVVLPHGGPEAHDEYAFDYFVQFLATRGYAVLQPQFRGSTGYGDAHRRAGYRQWGGLMQDDVTDGVKAMIAQGVADPGRVCIVGISYGGFAALAGATLTPELYACAVSINGVSDLPGMLGYEGRAGDDWNAIAYWREHIGPRHDPKVTERSPSRNADRARAPILLVHGVSDSVVPIQQSELMAVALQRAGKPFEFVRVEGADHWLSTGASRTRVLEATGEFLRKQLAPAGAAAP